MNASAETPATPHRRRRFLSVELPAGMVERKLGFAPVKVAETRRIRRRTKIDLAILDALASADRPLGTLDLAHEVNVRVGKTRNAHCSQVHYPLSKLLADGAVEVYGARHWILAGRAAEIERLEASRNVAARQRAIDEKVARDREQAERVAAPARCGDAGHRDLVRRLIGEPDEERAPHPDARLEALFAALPDASRERQTQLEAAGQVDLFAHSRLALAAVDAKVQGASTFFRELAPAQPAGIGVLIGASFGQGRSSWVGLRVGASFEAIDPEYDEAERWLNGVLRHTCHAADWILERLPYRSGFIFDLPLAPLPSWTSGSRVQASWYLDDRDTRLVAAAVARSLLARYRDGFRALGWRTRLTSDVSTSGDFVSCDTEWQRRCARWRIENEDLPAEDHRMVTLRAEELVIDALGGSWFRVRGPADPSPGA